jgi:hypothetical protein
MGIHFLEHCFVIIYASTILGPIFLHFLQLCALRCLFLPTHCPLSPTGLCWWLPAGPGRCAPRLFSNGNGNIYLQPYLSHAWRPHMPGSCPALPCPALTYMALPASFIVRSPLIWRIFYRPPSAITPHCAKPRKPTRMKPTHQGSAMWPF